MSLTPSPSESVAAPKKRPPPFSIRLNEEERERLTQAANGIPLASFIKATMLGYAPPVRRRTSPLPIQDRRVLSQGLALLARSRIANNLNQLAKAANLGILPVTPETEAELKEALLTLRRLRDLMMAGLGYKMDEPL
jgi:nitroreductase